MSIHFIVFLVCYYMEVAGATGKLYINYEYFDSRGRTSNGNICDSNGSECDPKFDICLRYGHTNVAFTCSSTGIVSPQIMTDRYSNTDRVVFGKSIFGTNNPVVYSTDSRFDGKFEISMFVTDYEGAAYPVATLDTVIMKVTASKTATYSSRLTFSGLRLTSPSTAAIRYAFICNTNYYGSYCTVYCLARNDMTYSYACDSQTGNKICSAGFRGNSCISDSAEISSTFDTKLTHPTSTMQDQPDTTDPYRLHYFIAGAVLTVLSLICDSGILAAIIYCCVRCR